MMSDNNMKKIITKELKKLGCPAHLDGYEYVRDAIELVITDRSMLESVTKTLYPTVAKNFGTTSSRVERAIRHAVEAVWDNADCDTLDEYFGYSVNSNKPKATNKHFIATMADMIKLDNDL